MTPVSASQSRAADFDQRIEHRLQIECRAADDLEHVGGGGLLLQSDCWRSSLSSRVFSMAMTAWAAKFLTSSICLSVKGRTSWRYSDERTDQFILLQHRDGQKCPYAPKLDGCNVCWIALFNVGRVCSKIGDVNHRFGRHHATDSDFRIGTER